MPVPVAPITPRPVRWFERIRRGMRWASHTSTGRSKSASRNFISRGLAAPVTDATPPSSPRRVPTPAGSTASRPGCGCGRTTYRTPGRDAGAARVGLGRPGEGIRRDGSPIDPLVEEPVHRLADVALHDLLEIVCGRALPAVGRVEVLHRGDEAVLAHGPGVEQHVAQHLQHPGPLLVRDQLIVAAPAVGGARADAEGGGLGALAANDLARVAQ